MTHREVAARDRALRHHRAGADGGRLRCRRRGCGGSRLARTGQPAPERIQALREHPGRRAETQVTEVFGQRKLLKWSVPGIAHS